MSKTKSGAIATPQRIIAGLVALLLLCLGGVWIGCLRHDARAMERVERNIAGVSVGDTRDAVREKLGEPIGIYFPTGLGGLFDIQQETWVYGRKYQTFPDFDVFRGGFPIGITKVRFARSLAEDYEILFDKSGKVELIETPVVSAGMTP